MKRASTVAVSRYEDLKRELEMVNFSRETAEQSVIILEQELQRKIKQLEEAKQSQMLSASKISSGKLTPGKFALPPFDIVLLMRFWKGRDRFIGLVWTRLMARSDTGI